MANINGNEIYFGIIGEVGGGNQQPVGEPTRLYDGVTSSVQGQATYHQGG